MVTGALQCIPLPDDVSLEHGSMHCVNPLTAIGLLDRARQYKAQAVIQTAAASQLGRMINRLGMDEGWRIINVVRKEEQVEILKEMGCKYILNSSDADFDEKLRDLAHELNATVCFEAIAGSFTGRIFKLMPVNSRCILYGCLSEQPVSDIDPMIFIGRNHSMETFFLPNWLKEKYIWQQLGIIRRCINLMRTKTFESNVNKRVSLHEMKEALKEYKQNMSAGKVVIYPH